ncbi:UDP-glucose dehydrogenase family protein [Paenibacillus rigui]|uniref:UDP-glucose 6-dehydrogenase n=1 Tax=Paenibacillus rigui TaxID=554312 RepID=A0A229UR36_9BACL|nr:UDP-glucose/GDP-mannose dehydrogenase family protein [Paenibacillus rigui]OXM85868.1 UDP-glucose 6-dehydrogenase [Paenibacillus rigui]
MGENVAVIGTGYVGLVTGACFAEIGHKVICVDKDQLKIKRLAEAQIPIYEPGLQRMVAEQLEHGRLAFTCHLPKAVEASDIVYIAVGTPSLDNGEVDLSQVKEVVTQIAEAIERASSYRIVVIKSTVPVGTARRMEQMIREGAPSANFAVVANPEFLREGSALHDTFHMDRIVIGCSNTEAGERIGRLHEPFGAPVLYTDRESAELVKYASNAFLAAKISFINEMAHVCDKVGADIELVARGMGMDRRIGSHFLQAGIGYGGSCFPKDTKAQLRIAEDVDYDFKILRSVIEVNALQRERFVHTIERALGGSVKSKRVAVMGLTFKPNTDDLRDAPALDIISSLVDKGAEVRAYDPVALSKAAPLLPQARLVEDPYEALQGADAMIITTEWDTVKALDYTRVKGLLAHPIVIDGRNCFPVERMERLGFRYVSVGRPGSAVEGNA